MASTFGCDSKKKIEIKDMINKCECSDGSECIWTTDRRPVYGNIPFDYIYKRMSMSSNS